jgi:hypothetical protein
MHSDFPNTLYFPSIKHWTIFFTLPQHHIWYTTLYSSTIPGQIFTNKAKPRLRSMLSLQHISLHRSLLQPGPRIWTGPQSPAHRSFQQTCLTHQFPACSWLLWNEGSLWSDSTLHQTTSLYFRFRNILLKCIYTVRDSIPKCSWVLPQPKYPPVSGDHSSETCCLLNSFPRKTWLNLHLINFRRNKLQ